VGVASTRRNGNVDQDLLLAPDQRGGRWAEEAKMDAAGDAIRIGRVSWISGVAWFRIVVIRRQREGGAGGAGEVGGATLGGRGAAAQTEREKAGDATETVNASGTHSPWFCRQNAQGQNHGGDVALTRFLGVEMGPSRDE
jgi:hypothetical protein